MEPQVPTVPTTIEWPFDGQNVRVGVWTDDRWVWTKLSKNEQGHSVVLPLRPNTYWVTYEVDGVICRNPYLSWQRFDDGVEVNFLCVKATESQNKQCEGCPITYRHSEECNTVYVLGSWDNWKQWYELTSSGRDHVRLMWVLPGKYLMRFSLDGKNFVDKGSTYELHSNGYEYNSVNVTAEPQVHELHGHAGAALLDDFMALPENEVSVVVKFNAGSQCGSINPEAKACPCTEVGYMLANGFIHCLKQEYLRGYSWAGCFKPYDMVVVDKKHCQIRRRASKLLTRLNLLLDVYQLKECLLLKYRKDDLLPPYFSSLFKFLEHPPEDFDSNKASRDQFLGFFDNQAALAIPPRRMLALVNMGQFFKQLPEESKSTFALLFNPILKEASDWQKTTFGDILLKSVFTAKRKLKSDGTLVTPVPNTSLEATYSLRIFFVHGPEHTIENQVQVLKDFVEMDLIIAHYFSSLLADFLELVHKNMHADPLIKAMWDFYCGGAPPDHLKVISCSK